MLRKLLTAHRGGLLWLPKKPREKLLILPSCLLLPHGLLILE